MRQGDVLNKEKQEKQKQQELEDASKWSLRKPSTPSLLDNSASTGPRNQKKRLLKRIQTVSYDDIYNTNNDEQLPGRHSYGSFAKQVRYL